MGAERAIVVPPGEGHRVGNVEFLARSKDTPRFNLAIITIEAHRDGPDVHSHAGEDDAFYILEGELTFTVDGEQVVAGPGDLRPRPARRLTHVREPWRRGRPVRQRPRPCGVRPPPRGVVRGWANAPSHGGARSLSART